MSTPQEHWAAFLRKRDSDPVKYRGTAGWNLALKEAEAEVYGPGGKALYMARAAAPSAPASRPLYAAGSQELADAIKREYRDNRAAYADFGDCQRRYRPTVAPARYSDAATSAREEFEPGTAEYRDAASGWHRIAGGDRLQRFTQFSRFNARYQAETGILQEGGGVKPHGPLSPEQAADFAKFCKFMKRYNDEQKAVNCV